MDINDKAAEVVKVGSQKIKEALDASPRPVRWGTVALAAAGVGVLLVMGAPLLRYRPVRRVAKIGAGQLLAQLLR